MILVYELSDIVAEDKPNSKANPIVAIHVRASIRTSRAPFFLFFVGLFVFLVILIHLHVLQYAYAKLGLSSGAALLLLLASLIGGYFNIPLTELPEREVRSGQVIEFFGMRYVVPLVTDWPRTVIAVNIGGAVIPTLLSLYLLVKNWRPMLASIRIASMLPGVFATGMIEELAGLLGPKGRNETP
jgi:uncharacterized membrane protein